MNRRFFLTLQTVLLMGTYSVLPAQTQQPARYDVLVYGGTPAGLAAACAAADEGRSVVLVEPFSFVGGLVTNGLSHTDFRSLECHSGFWWDFTQRVYAHYVKEYGKDSEQAKLSFHGQFGEPKVNQQVFETMLAERKGVTVLTRHSLVNVASTRSMPSRIISAVFRKEGGAQVTLAAGMFIDASYEGDLMAKAGVEYTVGREDEAKYGESLAKNVPAGGDKQVQGYNFRWCMTLDPANKLPATKPEGYKREDFLPVLDLYKNKKLTHVFGVAITTGLEVPDSMGAKTSKAIYKVQPPFLPNDKTDINDMSHGLVRLSMPDINDGYPDASDEERSKIVQQHLTYALGLLYFLQNDPDVPADVREDAHRWGFPKDEFANHNHLPEQLYVREARRMVGTHIFTQNDTAFGPDDVRIPLKEDSIAIGDYSHNCHGTGREGTRFNGKHTGEFYQRAAPYQVPYGTLVPLRVTNLLVPVAASSSHVGFCALRLEPIWTQMGHAAGFAAHLALKGDVGSVQKVDVKALQRLLHTHGAATIYVNDVPQNSPDYAAVQWMGMLGGLHGFHKSEGENKPLWQSLFGQYAKAYPLHEAGLDTPVDEALLGRWTALLPESVRSKAGSLALKADGKTSRGDVIRAWYKLSAE
ncbi:FAD-dependent oxidoreductase [Roseimicrobium sp. ORNL1]|uniref:FAD-dependent oxidoreductase n=1 Tax=Roseimicrobium sp. ORNL1 TaxID=2711231 RepID=UPI0013EBDADD|nr:FAD-dependent oxidoreductase [Roseimicrobium sp. ORNL1]